MLNLIALIAATVSAAYSDIDSNHWLYGVLFPIVTLLGIGYIFWFKGFIAIIAGAVAGYFVDFASVSLLRSLVLPFFVLMCICYLLWWMGLGSIFENYEALQKPADHDNETHVKRPQNH